MIIIPPTQRLDKPSPLISGHLSRRFNQLSRMDSRQFEPRDRKWWAAVRSPDMMYFDLLLNQLECSKTTCPNHAIQRFSRHEKVLIPVPLRQPETDMGMIFCALLLVDCERQNNEESWLYKTCKITQNLIKFWLILPGKDTLLNLSRCLASAEHKIGCVKMICSASI